jgi:lysophospholipase L1-like esterase
MTFLALLALQAGSFEAFDRKATDGETLSVVFFGASLTWGANATDPNLTSYRANVGRRLEKAYPKARFHFWDAAIGGTGSQLGVFRLERDVLRRSPDLVFLDFSANDGLSSATPETLASYEAIVRRILAKAPVVPVIFPFMWDVEKATLDGFLRRDAHLAIAKAYGLEAGDAVGLAQERVRGGAALKAWWPADGVHPGDAGYELFADAAWDAFRRAVDRKAIGTPPAAMLHAATYLTSRRVRLTSLGLPSGWSAGSPRLTSAYFDMLMSRWLDDVAVAKGKAEPWTLKIRGSMVLLFGESTTASAKLKVTIDGAAKGEVDVGDLAKKVGGTCHFNKVLVEGLDASVEHVLELTPVFADDKQELRIESVCVAGDQAGVKP